MLAEVRDFGWPHLPQQLLLSLAAEKVVPAPSGIALRVRANEAEKRNTRRNLSLYSERGSRRGCRKRIQKLGKAFNLVGFINVCLQKSQLSCFVVVFDWNVMKPVKHIK